METPNEPKTKVKMLINKKQAKIEAQKHQVRVSKEALHELDNKMKTLLAGAAERTKLNKHKTIQVRDL